MTPATATRRATELQCQATIVAAAKLGGWLCHAERAAIRQSGRWSTPIQGDVGFPDLILIRGTRLVAIELKRRPNKVTKEQTAWLEAFSRVGFDAWVVYVPENQQALIDMLVARP